MSDDLTVTYNGVNLAQRLKALHDVDFAVVSIDGDGVHGAVNRTVTLHGSDGDRRVDTAIPARTIGIGYRMDTGRQISHDALKVLTEAEQTLNQILHRPGKPARLVLSHRDGHFLAQPGQVGRANHWAHYSTGVIEMQCHTPFLYGVQRTVSPSGGTVTIRSNYFVEPVILWTTSTAVGAAWIEVDGQRLTIDTGISAGQQVRIDSTRKETRVGGVLDVENVKGVYPRMYDGSTITTSPGGTLNITYTERWI